MTKLFCALIAGFIGTSSFAASPVGAPMAGAAPGEAMRAGDPNPETAAQAKVGKKNSTDAQMKRDAAKL